MARGRQKEEWSRLSVLLAKVHNCHCTEPISPDDVNPFVEPQVQSITVLKQHFVKDKA